MIVFDLKCKHNHQFESWFRSTADYDLQRESELVECPYCGSVEVKKAVMAPNIGAKSNQKTQTSQLVDPSRQTVNAVATGGANPEMQKLTKHVADAVEKLRKHVEKNCENVGDKFVDEARKIHYGESEERGIYGESSFDEARELLEEGIDIMPLPGTRRTDA